MWNRAAELLDELWFVEVDERIARQRLIARHVKTGVAKDEAEAAIRADENDLVNGREIMEKRLPVSELIKSVQDQKWNTDQ